MILRYDKGIIKSKHFTPEGFLKVEGVATRIGIFKYRNADGSIRSELRHPEQVFKDDSLKSMENIPITLLHPSERIVDSKNAKKLSVGSTGEKVSHDGELITINMVVRDQKAIDAIESGVQELSLGYKVVLVDEQGEFKGERFDTRQTEIVYNHLAIVPQGRAGKEAKIILDSDDAVQFIEDENKNKPKQKKEENTMDLVKVSLDSGLQYDAAPEVKVALEAANSKVDTAEKALSTATTENDTLQAAHDILDEKVKSFEKTDNKEEIASAVKARILLVSSAAKHLDEKALEGLEEKTDEEIKGLVIKKYSPELSLDEKSEAYIDARFDAALENKVEVKKDEKSKISSQRSKVNGESSNSDSSDEPSQTKSREDMIIAMKSQHKPAPVKA